MSGEATFYILFIMLTLSMGLVFQFILGRIKKISLDIKKINESIAKLHQEAHQNRNNSRRSTVQKTQNTRSLRNKQLSGNLSLEYQGQKAITRATFYIDKES